MLWRWNCNSQLRQQQEALCYRFRMLGEGSCSNVSIGIPIHKPKSVKASSSHLTKTQSTGIEVDPIPDLLTQNRLEID